MPGKRLSALLWATVLAGAIAPPARAQLPENWIAKDIGGPAGPGKTTFEKATGAWTVAGEGSDIWGSEDQFQYAYTQLKGDGHISARILSQQGGHEDGWGRNGLMIRESDDPASRHFNYTLGVVPEAPTPSQGANSGGLFYCYRRAENGSSDHFWQQTLGDFPQLNQEARSGAVGLRELPAWIRVQRKGNLITAFLSRDGKIWSQQTVPQSLGSVPLPETMLAGIAVSGHNPEAGTPATVSMDNVTVGNELLLEGPSDLAVTASRTDNRVLLTWTGRQGATGYTLYRRAQGEDPYVKAGSTTDLTWFIDAGPDGSGLKAGTNYQYFVTATVPQQVGTDMVPVETGASYPAPVTPGPIPSAIGPFLSYDVGTSFAGATTLDNQGVLTIRASGWDIWNEGDGMRFVGTEFRGNIAITARILEKPTSDNRDGWVKAGLMVRESLAPGARNGFVGVSSNDAADHASTYFQMRRHFNNTADESNVSQDGTSADATQYPLFLRIVRTWTANQTRIEGFQSADGKTFTKIGGDEGGVTLDRMAARAYVGFAVTNHRDGDLATARFDSVTFQ